MATDEQRSKIMWLKHKNLLINLDKVQAIHCHTRAQGRCELIFEYTGDDDQWINFKNKEEMLSAYNVIIHALQPEVCVIDAE